MRAIVTLLAIIVIVAIVAVATGLVNFHGSPGTLPTVSGGSLPTVKADVARIDVGTKNETVDVPKVSVGTKPSTVAVPTVSVQKPQ